MAVHLVCVKTFQSEPEMLKEEKSNEKSVGLTLWGTWMSNFMSICSPVVDILGL